jgi:hypothetical protein
MRSAEQATSNYWRTMQRAGYRRAPGVQEAEVHAALALVLEWKRRLARAQTEYHEAMNPAYARAGHKRGEALELSAGVHYYATIGGDSKRFFNAAKAHQAKEAQRVAQSMLDSARLWLSTLVQEPQSNVS